MFQHPHIMQCSDFNKPVSTKNPKSNVLFLIQFLPYHRLAQNDEQHCQIYQLKIW